MRFTEDFVLKVEEEKKMEDVSIANETFIRPSKIEVRGRDEGTNHEDEQEKEKRQKLEGGGGGGGGGILDNLLSKLTSPRPTNNNIKDSEDHVLVINNNDHSDNGVRGDGEGGSGDGEGGGDNGGGGGGVINNLISNLFHKSSEGEGENVKNNGSEEKLKCRNEKSEVSKKVDDKENEGGNSNGGSLISNLVQDVAAPEGDEASILIQSIVHD